MAYFCPHNDTQLTVRNYYSRESRPRNDIYGYSKLYPFRNLEASPLYITPQTQVA